MGKGKKNNNEDEGNFINYRIWWWVIIKKYLVNIRWIN
jgi:hypothetical protein